MLEIFIPTKIFEKLTLNTFKKEYKKTLQDNFENIEIKEFKTKIISGIHLKLPKYDEDLIIFANGFFGKKYFYDADFTKQQINSFGHYFYKDSGYFSDLNNLENEIFEIKDILESKKLLTNTKKDEILERISYIFYMLSGIYFNIYTLLEKTDENISELENIDGEIQFEATASLVMETSKTKKVELEANLQSLENYISNFYTIIEKYFFN